MIFFGALFFAVVLGTLLALARDLYYDEYLILMAVLFVGLWSGFEFWSLAYSWGISHC